MESEKIKHESFGQISFHRVTGRRNFYGSELVQEHYIMMEIHSSELNRDLTCERYYQTGFPLLRLRMSSGQFSELITSLNQGSGVPCTLEYINGKKVADIPVIESRKEFVHRKFEDRMSDFADRIKKTKQETKEIVKKKTLSKEDVRVLSNNLDWLVAEIESNIPFFGKCFQETMDEMIFEAKLEVENAIQHKISVLGLNALYEQNKLLNTNEENIE